MPIGTIIITVHYKIQIQIGRVIFSKFCVNVWDGIFNNILLRVMEDLLNGYLCTNIIGNTMFAFVEDMPHLQQNMWFQTMVHHLIEHESSNNVVKHPFS